MHGFNRVSTVWEAWYVASQELLHNPGPEAVLCAEMVRQMLLLPDDGDVLVNAVQIKFWDALADTDAFVDLTLYLAERSYLHPEAGLVVPETSIERFLEREDAHERLQDMHLRLEALGFEPQVHNEL